MKHNGYFIYQAIVIGGAHGAISFALCVGLSVIILLFTKKLTNMYKKILEFSTRVGTIAHQ